MECNSLNVEVLIRVSKQKEVLEFVLSKCGKIEAISHFRSVHQARAIKLECSIPTGDLSRNAPAALGAKFGSALLEN